MEIPIEVTVEIRFIEKKFATQPYRVRKGIYRDLRSKRRPEAGEQAAIALFMLAIKHEHEIARTASEVLGSRIDSWKIPAYGDRRAERVRIIQEYFRQNLRKKRGRFWLVNAAAAAAA